MRHEPGSARALLVPGLVAMVLVTVTGWLCNERYDPKKLPDDSAWMFRAEIITVMGFVAEGDQRPMQRSHSHRWFHAETQQTSAIAASIKENDVIVILRPTLEDLLGRITTATPRFTLVTVNYDHPITPELRRQICSTPSIRMFYGQNLMKDGTKCNAKIQPLPLGLNTHKYAMNLGPAGAIGAEREAMRLREQLAVGTLVKKPRVLVTHMKVMDSDSAGKYSPKDPRPIRQAYTDDLAKLDYVDVIEDIPFDEYLETIASYSFVSSPPGNGYDCFRTWEALVVGTVPIVHDDGIFDMRLFDGTGAWVTGHPSEVRRDFDARLADLKPTTATLPAYLSVKEWGRMFRKGPMGKGIAVAPPSAPRSAH